MRAEKRRRRRRWGCASSRTPRLLLKSRRTTSKRMDWCRTQRPMVTGIVKYRPIELQHRRYFSPELSLSSVGQRVSVIAETSCEISRSSRSKVEYILSVRWFLIAAFDSMKSGFAWPVSWGTSWVNPVLWLIFGKRGSRRAYDIFSRWLILFNWIVNFVLRFDKFTTRYLRVRLYFVTFFSFYPKLYWYLFFFVQKQFMNKIVNILDISIKFLYSLSILIILHVFLKSSIPIHPHFF